MQQSVVCVRYELGSFWFRYVLNKNGYVLVLYILTETIYKLKSAWFLTYIDRVRFDENLGTIWYGYVLIKMWVRFDQKWVRFGWVRFGLGTFWPAPNKTPRVRQCRRGFNLQIQQNGSRYYLP